MPLSTNCFNSLGRDEVLFFLYITFIDVNLSRLWLDLEHA
jgi:hypothetical protein